MSFSSPLRISLCLLVAGLLSLTGCGSDGDGGTDPVENRPPTLSISGESSVRVLVSGDVVDLSASASDPDGDGLTYAWSTEPAGVGSFDDSNVASPQWMVGEAAGNGLVVFRCEVSDGVNDPVAVTGASVELGTPLPEADYVADQTWAAADEPFVVRGDIRVLSGATLTIEPGVHVYFRPTSTGPGSIERHGIEVQGALIAEGTGSATSSSIRFRGDRLDLGGNRQHRGLRFVASSTGSLSFVSVRDGEVGLAVSSSQNVSVWNCTFTDGSVGVELNEPAQITLRRVRIEDNSLGTLNNPAQLVLRQARVDGNAGAGLTVNGGSTGAIADVDSCEFGNSGSSHLDVSAGVSFVNLTLKHSNLLPRGEGEDSIRLTAGFCAQLSLDLTTNFWSQQAETVQDVLDRIGGSQSCASDILSWSRVEGDWVTLAHALDLP